jgi:hypothetical protein
LLSKCANPVCPARFRYLHEGRIFNIEFKTNNADRSLQTRIEHFWLCETCARTLKVVWEDGVVSTRPLRLALADGKRKEKLRDEREVA